MSPHKVHIFAGMSGPVAASQAEASSIVGPVAVGWVLELFLFGIGKCNIVSKDAERVHGRRARQRGRSCRGANIPLSSQC